MAAQINSLVVFCCNLFLGCKPAKLWMLVRHGTRNPSVDIIRKMRERLPQIRNIILETGNNVEKYISNALKEWNLNIGDNDQKQLTHEGEDEMLHLAKRMQNRFPNLLSPIYSNSSYKVCIERSLNLSC